MDASLSHTNIEKVLYQTKLGRDFTMYGGGGQLQIHQASHLADLNYRIGQKIKLL